MSDSTKTTDGVPNGVIEYYVGKTVPTASKNPSFVGEENHMPFNDPKRKEGNLKDRSSLKSLAQTIISA